MLMYIAAFQEGNVVCRFSHTYLPETLFFLKHWYPEENVLKVMTLDSLKLIHGPGAVAE